MRIGIVSRGSPPGSHVVDRWRFDVLIRRLNSRYVDVQYVRTHVTYDLLIVPLRSDREKLIKSVASSGRCKIIGDVTDDVLAVALKRMLAPHRLSAPGRAYLSVRALFSRPVPRMAELVAACDALVVGSAAQGEAASRYSDAVHVITDAILENPFCAVGRPRKEGPLRLAWIGNVESLDGLVSIQEVLDRLPDIGDIELRLITGTQTKARILGKKPRNVRQFMDGQRIRCVFRPWHIDTFAREIAEADVGIVPVATESAFTLNKPAGRVLLFMAAGLPVIATPIRSHREVIASGDTGFLPDTTQGWVDAVHQLAQSVDLRQTLGTRARNFALTFYGEDSFAARYWQVIESVMGIS
jgi:glycosyltransferase involved in cell wall biosynthesis